MLRQEFDALLGDNTVIPTLKEYELIEFVYNWHPCNFSKMAIASLYKEFGMAIIYDMEYRAKCSMERNMAIESIDAQIKRLQARREELLKKDLNGCCDDLEENYD